MYKDEERFLEKGYHGYNPTPYDNESIVRRYQKRFDDGKGKRYFIDIVVWDNSFIPPDRRDKWWTQYTYEYETQLYRKESHEPVNLEYYAGWSLDMVEDNLEKLFNTGLFDYYEEWD